MAKQKFQIGDKVKVIKTGRIGIISDVKTVYRPIYYWTGEVGNKTMKKYTIQGSAHLYFSKDLEKYQGFDSNEALINYDDLCDNKFLGANFVKNLSVPGNYKIWIRSYNSKTGELRRAIAVEVVSTFFDNGTQFIVVPDNMHDYYYIFYYNGNEKCFKPNFNPDEEYEKILNWINIEVETDEDGNIIN